MEENANKAAPLAASRTRQARRMAEGFRLQNHGIHRAALRIGLNCQCMRAERSRTTSCYCTPVGDQAAGSALGTVATVVHEPGRFMQASYEGRDADIDRIRRVARQRGLSVSSGSMGYQITPVGRIKLNMVTIRGDTDRIAEEIWELQRKAAF